MKIFNSSRERHRSADHINAPIWRMLQCIYICCVQNGHGHGAAIESTVAIESELDTEARLVSLARTNSGCEPNTKGVLLMWNLHGGMPSDREFVGSCYSARFPLAEPSASHTFRPLRKDDLSTHSVIRDDLIRIAL